MFASYCMSLASDPMLAPAPQRVVRKISPPLSASAYYAHQTTRRRRSGEGGGDESRVRRQTSLVNAATLMNAVLSRTRSRSFGSFFDESVVVKGCNGVQYIAVLEGTPWPVVREKNYGQIETDAKSLNSLSNNSGHSRRSSDTSQVSVASGGSSSGQNGPDGDDVDRNSQDENWSLWGQIVNDWENFSKKKNQQLRELVRKGVPHHFRGIVWQLLCGSHNSPLKNKYVQYIKAPSPCEKVIRRDIARTYPEHDYFKEKDGFGQESLFNVMKAYSLHDREVGYCQGSAFIVGLLLMQVSE
ncbi:unnamed protein product [Notodromas monacha]|uniref:Rab-GAP TBC domain-containing protein n=1 Tax=Notodromas monacha TaxID=399045 RepID=A0A7R9BTT4_9CRUS|nr:unnamed protein product [Notodromas monacha]CAG0921624.1 unnamed protein product [Notodromas monacha]